MRQVYHSNEERREARRGYDHSRTRSYERTERRENPRNKPKTTPTQEGYRVCNDCGEKPLTEFHVRKGKSLAVCIECERARDRERNRLRRVRKTPEKPKAKTFDCKVCNTCWKEKPYSKFAKDPAQKDGYRGRCRQCYADIAATRSPEEREAEKVYNVAYREANLEALRAYDRQRYSTPQRKAAHLNRLSKRHALVHGAYAEEVDCQCILERDGYWCYICEKPILPGQKLAFDHVIPLLPRKGELQGFHTEDNIKPTHHVCNARKSNKPFSVLTPFDRRGVD